MREQPVSAIDADETRTCLTCGDTFVFPDSQREREFFIRMGFPPPKRCPSCRAAAKREARSW